MAPSFTKKLVGVLLLTTLVATGCNNSTSPPSTTIAKPKAATPFVAPGSDPWNLTWTDQSNWSPPVLWNGLIGVRIGANGLSNDESGSPMPLFLIDDYDKTGSESIRIIDNPVQFSIAQKNLVPASNWKQTLNLRDGVVVTTYALRNGDDVEARAVVDPSSQQVSYKVHIKGSGDHVDGAPLTYSNPSQGGDHIAAWKELVTAPVTDLNGPLAPRVFSGSLDKSGIEGHLRVDAGSAGMEGVADDAPYEAETQQTLSFGSQHAKTFQSSHVMYGDIPATFDQVASRSSTSWISRWKTDIEIDGPVEDQQAVRSFMFYLRSAISPSGNMSISPMGLSNDIYSGHVFWDADIWVFPALALIDPDAAKVIPTYRLARLNAAQENYKQWVSDGAKTGFRTYSSPNAEGFESPGANGRIWPELHVYKLPWESSITGRETAQGDSRYEEHISGSVAFSLDMAANLGLAKDTESSFARTCVSNYYDRRMQGDNTTNNRELHIKGVMSPDENHIGNDDLYTNLLAQWCADGGKWVDRKTRITYDKPVDFYLPQDKTSFLTYDNDPIKGYKQAAAVLAIYPLQYPPAEAQAKVMMDRFADKVIKNGPAMTDSVHSIVWARLGESDKAYDAWRHGWMDFVRPPFLLFSEKRNQDRTYFTTGAGGELQSVIYGFLGFRIDSKPEEGASWSLKLKGDRWLSIKPNLPQAWKRVTFRNFHVLGKSYTLTATHQSVQVTQGD